MKKYLVVFYKKLRFWQEVMTVTDVATEIWLNDSLSGVPLCVKEIE